MTDHIAIAGIGMTFFGRFLDRSVASPSDELVRVALEDAGIGAERVDRVFFAKAELINNPGGGLISKDHPIGATGTAQMSELAQQLCGEAGARQRESAKVALAQNSGGQVGGDSAAAVVSILVA